MRSLFSRILLGLFLFGGFSLMIVFGADESRQPTTPTTPTTTQPTTPTVQPSLFVRGPVLGDSVFYSTTSDLADFTTLAFVMEVSPTTATVEPEGLIYFCAVGCDKKLKINFDDVKTSTAVAQYNNGKMSVDLKNMKNEDGDSVTLTNGQGYTPILGIQIGGQWYNFNPATNTVYTFARVKATINIDSEAPELEFVRNANDDQIPPQRVVPEDLQIEKSPEAGVKKDEYTREKLNIDVKCHTRGGSDCVSFGENQVKSVNVLGNFCNNVDLKGILLKDNICGLSEQKYNVCDKAGNCTGDTKALELVSLKSVPVNQNNLRIKNDDLLAPRFDSVLLKNTNGDTALKAGAVSLSLVNFADPLLENVVISGASTDACAEGLALDIATKECKDAVTLCKTDIGLLGEKDTAGNCVATGACPTGYENDGAGGCTLPCKAEFSYCFAFEMKGDGAKTIPVSAPVVACSGLPANASWQIGHGSSEPNCNWSCKIAYTKNGNACVLTTQSCNIPNGSGTQTWDSSLNAYRPCDVTCNTGYSKDGSTCVLTTRSCFVAYGRGSLTWDSSLNTYGSCNVINCIGLYHVENGKCVSNTRDCPIENGKGTQVWYPSHYGYSICSVTSCDPGYTKSGNSCVKDQVACSNFSKPSYSNWDNPYSSNRSASGCNWSCNSGYSKNGSICVPVVVACPILPGNASWQSGNGSSEPNCNWSCNDGYIIGIGGDSCVSKTAELGGCEIDYDWIHRDPSCDSCPPGGICHAQCYPTPCSAVGEKVTEKKCKDAAAYCKFVPELSLPGGNLF